MTTSGSSPRPWSPSSSRPEPGRRGRAGTNWHTGDGSPARFASPLCQLVRAASARSRLLPGAEGGDVGPGGAALGAVPARLVGRGVDVDVGAGRGRAHPEPGRAEIAD